MWKDSSSIRLYNLIDLSECKVVRSLIMQELNHHFHDFQQTLEYPE